MGKNNKYDFIEYKHAAQVIKDYPGILRILSKLIPALRDKSHYTGVNHLLQAAIDSKILLEMQFDYYKKIYESKGKNDE